MEDVNLRLAVVDALLESGVLPPFDLEAFNRTLDPADTDDDDDDDRDYRYRDEVADALLAIPVSREQVASVRRLYWYAGGPRVIRMIWTYWDGESDEFHIESLAGIAEALPALEELGLDLCRVSDLTPLAGCTGLRSLDLDGGFGITDVGPLARLPALRELRLGHQAVTDLGPLAGTAIEELHLWGNGQGTAPWAVDLSALADMPALRTFRCVQSVRRSGEEIPMLTAFDNARVLTDLRDRGVTVKLG
ncbi:leucine-rich repeat domain-containing protein [Dactylosporangium sp. CA-092794]|uniref:leucine-rich repeat domain-containing protein n=1 Tax=Dactylosporangium sp. CA-092794 TaxID=3239929 RepID=UPI003D94BB30